MDNYIDNNGNKVAGGSTNNPRRHVLARRITEEDLVPQSRASVSVSVSHQSQPQRPQPQQQTQEEEDGGSSAEEEAAAAGETREIQVVENPRLASPGTFASAKYAVCTLI